MPDEVTFMDMAALLKITPNTPLERLGSALNASIFDASNIAGSLKQKGLIEFTAYYPGPNAITITDLGKALIAEADSKSTTTIDSLDDSILTQLSGGKRLPVELQNTLNIRPRDLALRLYKLNKQDFLMYELKNGGADLMLTEKGFLKAKGGLAMQRQVAGPQYAAATAQQQTIQQMAQQGPEMQTPETPGAMPGPKMDTPRRSRRVWIVAMVVIIVIILAALRYGHII